MTTSNQEAIYQVDRAIAQIRRGGLVFFETNSGGAFLFCAAEFFDRDSQVFSGDSSFFALPENRYRFLKEGEQDFSTSYDSAICITDFDAVHIAAELLSRDDSHSLSALEANPLPDNLKPMLRLLKWSYALPVALIRPLSNKEEKPSHMPMVSEELLEEYLSSLPSSINLISSAKLPIAATEQAEILAYGSRSSSQEHFVLRIGSPSAQQSSPLVRMHSECFTGDLLASLRCDCGSQLHGAIDLCVEAGFGLILYLHQEGRGIGLANKVRAYALQDKGLDTVQANAVLGFHPDERDFAVAQAILESLGVTELRLISNNPYKKESLESAGFKVEKLVALKIAPTSHSQAYLDTKVEKMGHKL
jgi:GTP cyclohydrolase II